MTETLQTVLRTALNPFPKFWITTGPELCGEPPFRLKNGRIGQVNAKYVHERSPRAARP